MGYRAGYYLTDLKRLADRFSNPEYTDMAVDHLIERAKGELDRFWKEVAEYEYKPGARGFVCPASEFVAA